MAGWPSIDRTDEQRLAQALRDGDETALAQIYDTFAPRLFDYCHVLLRDQESASMALHDSLITVQERMTSLPDVRLFRGWLYAVTRNECLRRKANAEVPVERQRAPEAEGLVEADEATRQLVHAALLVLGGAQREALDLSLRHELDPHELAEVLSVSPHEASLMVEQARNDLDDAFAAVVISATGREDCPSVAALAGPPGRQLDAETCGKLSRHITNCPICGARGNRKVATARLLHAMPVAAIPPTLRSRVITAASSPEFADMRASIAMRSEPVSAVDYEPEPEEKSRVWPAFAAAAVGILLIGGLFMLLPGASNGKKAADSNPALSASPSDSPSEDALPPEDFPAPTPTPSKTKPSPTPSKSKSPKPSKSPKATIRPKPPKPTPGTLSVSGCHMRGTYSCTITLTAVGGSVNWSVAGTSNGLTASGSGTLSAGESTSVKVQRHGWCLGNGSGSVSFSPNGTASITWNC